jgi:SAM-dependent methyltransferase
MIDILSKTGSWFFSKKKSFCPVCDKANACYSALPDYYRDNALKHGYAYFGKGEMTALETYACSNCGASDRERLYAYWIGLQFKLNYLSDKSKIIHFAPEVALSIKLRTLNLNTYHTADLMMDGCDYKIDIMRMPFEDESYNFFICSHLLEHVESDDKAISELYRITKKGGGGILMVPIINGLKNTVEDSSITDEAGRWRNFGQNDHVRLYAHDDFLNKAREHGFSVQELGEKHFGKTIFKRLGLKRSSVLYVVTK